MKHLGQEDRRVDRHCDEAAKCQEVVEARNPALAILEGTNHLGECLRRIAFWGISGGDSKDEKSDCKQNPEGPESPSKSDRRCDDWRTKSCERLANVPGTVYAERKSLLVGRVPPAHESHANGETR